MTDGNGPHAEGLALRDAAGEIGAVVADLEISRTWLVDPASGREGPGEIVVSDGRLEAVTWLEGGEADGIGPDGVIVAHGFVDLHAHLREPGQEDAETIASGLAAAAHGGFTAVCAMPDTTPPMDEPGVLERVRAAAAATHNPVRVLPVGAVTAGRAGEQLAAIGELADAGVVAFSDDPLPIVSAALLRNAMAYAGTFGLPIIVQAEDPALTAGAEAHDGFIATVLGLRGWPAAAEEAIVARDVALLAEVVRDVPGARLHFAHLSCASSLAVVRQAKARGLPVTCDIAPWHTALSDEWLAGSRRYAWDVPAESRGPWADGAIVDQPYDVNGRSNPPLRTPADAAACLGALIDGTAAAVVSNHAPRTQVEMAVEFGLASFGLSGLETALGLLLAAVDADRLPLSTAISALTTGPAAVLGRGSGGDVPGLVEGAPADLVVFDRSASWTVTADGLASRGKNTPLIGRELSGPVILTVAGGRLAYAGDVAG